MREPSNSWEISYVILTRRPNKQLGITYKGLVKKIDYSRLRELNDWAYEYYSQRWLIDHI